MIPHDSEHLVHLFLMGLAFGLGYTRYLLATIFLIGFVGLLEIAQLFVPRPPRTYERLSYRRFRRISRHRQRTPRQRIFNLGASVVGYMFGAGTAIGAYVGRCDRKRRARRSPWRLAPAVRMAR